MKKRDLRLAELSEFETRLKRIRNERNMTQEDLAVRSTLDVKQINSYENGRNLPSLENLILICSALEIPVDSLIVYSPDLVKKWEADNLGKKNAVLSVDDFEQAMEGMLQTVYFMREKIKSLEYILSTIEEK